VFSNRRSEGVALVSVLLIVAVLLAITSRLLAGHNLVINQNANTFEQDQALQYVIGAEVMARQALFDDFINTGPESDHSNELWAQNVLPFDLDEGDYLQAQLTDLNGCFNLNSVVAGDGKVGLQQFKRMLNNLGVSDQIAEAWKDWIDDDQEVTGFGAEDNEYLSSENPHRTPNRLVTHTSELYLLQGMTQANLDLLLPHVCLLPDATSKINVNTANAFTLSALHPDISPATVEQIVSVERDFRDMSEFLSVNEDFRPVQGQLTVRSEYFQLHAQAQVGSSSITLLSLLYRDPSNGHVSIIQRDFGKLFRSNLVLETDIQES
jgi:general secretion pathway protein K